MAIDLFRSFLERATASGSRSTVMMELRWFLGIVCSGLILGVKFGSPAWIQILLAILLSVASLIYFGVYIFFAVKSPDSLRSETFTLSKLAIEKSMRGDDLVGLINPEIQTLPEKIVSPKEDAK